MKRSNEPIFWALFGAGGVLSALAAPILIFITGIITPVGLWMPEQALAYSRVLGFAQHWLGKLLLLAVIALFLFHAAHRIYHGLHDIGVHAGAGAKAATYGGALLATAAAVYLLVAIGF
jgi:fumarate reductase subunit D